MRLIDADALLESAGVFEVKACARGCGKSTLHLAKAWLWNEVQKAPTIDAVPVCRCKDCKHRRFTGVAPFMYHCCGHNDGLVGKVNDDDFRSYGERKEADGK